MLNLSQVIVRPVGPSEEPRFQELMQQHHYLGALPKIGNTIWYFVTCNDEWLGLVRGDKKQNARYDSGCHAGLFGN